jgi:hypothetical protein
MGIFENLSEYELADWLEDFVNNQKTEDNSEMVVKMLIRLPAL